MLVEMAIGDAFGACFEMKPVSFVEKYNNPISYPSTRHPGIYTDDTQMAVAMAELMLADRKWSELSIANSLVACYKRDPRKGYARGFGMLLDACCDGEALLTAIRPNSVKSGAAMRSPPLGLFKTGSEVVAKAFKNASVTHDTDEGRNSAAAAALMVHCFAFRQEGKDGLRDFVSYFVEGPWWTPWYGPVGNLGYQAVNAAITAIEDSKTLSDVLRKSVAFTGDTDTVASIAMAAASFSREIKNDLPEALVQGLEDGPFGRKYLRGLDEELCSKFLV